MSPYLGRGNVIGEENVGFYSDWSEKRDRRTLKRRTVERMVQVWYNGAMLYIYISRMKGRFPSRHPALRRETLLETPIRRREADARQILTSCVTWLLRSSSTLFKCVLKMRWINSRRDISPLGISLRTMFRSRRQLKKTIRIFAHRFSNFSNIFLTYFDRWRKMISIYIYDTKSIYY